MDDKAQNERYEPFLQDIYWRVAGVNKALVEGLLSRAEADMQLLAVHPDAPSEVYRAWDRVHQHITRPYQ